PVVPVPEPLAPEPEPLVPLVPDPLVPVRLEPELVPVPSVELPGILEPAGRAESPWLPWLALPASTSMGRPAAWATVLMWLACCCGLGWVGAGYCLVSWSG